MPNAFPFVHVWKSHNSKAHRECTVMIAARPSVTNEGTFLPYRSEQGKTLCPYVTKNNWAMVTEFGNELKRFARQPEHRSGCLPELPHGPDGLRASPA